MATYSYLNPRNFVFQPGPPQEPAKGDSGVKR